MNVTRWMRIGLFAGGLVLGSALTGAVMAQDQDAGQNQRQGQRRGGRGAGDPVAYVERSKERTMQVASLTDDQKSKLETVFKEAATDAEKLKGEVASLEAEARAEKMRPFTQGLREKINGVLTEEQRQAMRQGQGGGGQFGGRGFGERYRTAVKGLGLSSEQQQKFDALLTETEPKMRELNQPGQGGDPQEMRTKRREMMQEFQKKMGAILTTEQQEKLRESMRSQGGPGGRGRRGQDQGATNQNPRA